MIHTLAVLLAIKEPFPPSGWALSVGEQKEQWLRTLEGPVLWPLACDGDDAMEVIWATAAWAPVDHNENAVRPSGHAAPRGRLGLNALVANA